MKIFHKRFLYIENIHKEVFVVNISLISAKYEESNSGRIVNANIVNFGQGLANTNVSSEINVLLPDIFYFLTTD